MNELNALQLIAIAVVVIFTAGCIGYIFGYHTKRRLRHSSVAWKIRVYEGLIEQIRQDFKDTSPAVDTVLDCLPIPFTTVPVGFSRSERNEAIAFCRSFDRPSLKAYKDGLVDARNTVCATTGIRARLPGTKASKLVFAKQEVIEQLELQIKETNRKITHCTNTAETL